MKDHDQIRAIAEFDGWHNLKFDVRGIGAPERGPTWSGSPPGRKYNRQLPPYITSLDAIVPVTEKLTVSQQCKYGTCLALLVGAEGLSIGEVARRVAFATARQRCEALLRTTGKWDEDTLPT